MQLNAFVLLIAAAFCAPALANDTPPPNFSEIRAQQTEFRQEALAKKGPFKDLSDRERNELVAKQTELLTLIDGKQSLSDLTPDQQVSTINTLEWIKAAITKAEDERLICERVKLVGSNRPTRVCRTAAQVRADREAAEKSLEERKMCGGACRDN